MIDVIQHRLNRYGRFSITVAVALGLLLLVAAVGWRISTFQPTFVAAAGLAVAGIALAVWRLEAVIALLGFLAMLVNPSLFDVQGRVILPLHLLAGLVIAIWLLRRLVVEKSLRLPRTLLNGPLLALIVLWLITWLAGYAFWDSAVPTAHRQPLFFLAELGQMLLFMGVFWAVAEHVRDERWVSFVCAAMILGKTLTPFLFGHLLFIEYPVVLALTLSFLAFGRVGGKVRMVLLLALAVFLWDLIQINRIPIYTASLTVALVVVFFRSRRLFLLGIILSAIIGVIWFAPLWQAEQSVGSRLVLARLALAVFGDHPLLGIGPTHYRSYAILYHRNVSYGWHTVESGMLLPHNRWLYFLANVGIVGALGILWLVTVMIWEPLSVIRRTGDGLSKLLAVSAVACVAGVLVQSIGGHASFLPTYDMLSIYMMPVWILMGLLVARSQQSFDERNDA